jgi:hypothetical protein
MDVYKRDLVEYECLSNSSRAIWVNERYSRESGLQNGDQGVKHASEILFSGSISH